MCSPARTAFNSIALAVLPRWIGLRSGMVRRPGAGSARVSSQQGSNDPRMARVQTLVLALLSQELASMKGATLASKPGSHWWLEGPRCGAAVASPTTTDLNRYRITSEVEVAGGRPGRASEQFLRQICAAFRPSPLTQGSGVPATHGRFEIVLDGAGSVAGGIYSGRLGVSPADTTNQRIRS
jgi:hypothetical protein